MFTGMLITVVASVLRIAIDKAEQQESERFALMLVFQVNVQRSGNAGSQGKRANKPGMFIKIDDSS